MGIFEEMRVKQMKGKLIRQVTAALLLGGVCWGGTAFAAPSGSLDEYKLDDVVVTAERIPTAKMDTPANVTVITAREIEENHYSDMAEALSHVNGVDINSGASGSDRIVRLNGDERVVIMIDGQRMNNDQGSMTRASANLNMIPSMKNIERIEVVKGGGSALYGSDAVGGVINIITKKGKTASTTLDLNTGSWGTHNYEMTNEGSDGNLSWFVTGGLQKRSYFSYKNGGSDHSMPNSDYNNNSFSMRLDDKIDDSRSVRFDFQHKSVNSGAYYYFMPNGTQNELFNNISLTYNFKEKQSTPGFVRYFDNYRSENYLGHFNTRLYGVDYQNGWQLGNNNRLIAGLEWHESKSTNLQSGYSDKEITNKAVYLQDTMKLSNKWSFVPGIRVDHHNMFGTHWTPKAAFNYKADQKTKMYASWGKVYKAPTADDLYYNNAAWHYYGNPHLQPESGYTETLGIDHDFDNRTSMQFSIFKSEIHDAIDWLNLVGGTYVSNVGWEKKHGLELAFQKKVNQTWSYDLAYSYIHTETSDAGTNGYLLSNNNLPNGYHVNLHYTKNAWTANLMGTFGSGLNTACYPVSSYAVLDFNLSYALNQQSKIYFKINNLTNQEYAVFPNAAKCYPAAGRFFQIGMTYSF